MNESVPQIVLLDTNDRHTHFESLRAAFPANYLEELHPLAVGIDPRSIDLALVSDEYNPVTADEIGRLRDVGIPVLHVVDGIAEWRNTWENPRSQSQKRGAPMFQPILSDKIACLGRSQVRLLESWGNLGKCEIVGAPRFDPLLGRSARDRVENEPFRLLIMTARTPGFTKQQIECCASALADVKQQIEIWNASNSLSIQPVWRISAALTHRLDVRNHYDDLSGKTLASVLTTVDGMMSTPSTSLLEGMLQHIPVASLDYTNSPAYVPTAWSITAASHLEATLAELVKPPAAKMLWQETLLSDHLECRSPATPRLVELVQKMIDERRASLRESRPLRLADHLLDDSVTGRQWPQEQYDLKTLFPSHPVFANMDVVQLQTQLIQARLVEEMAKQVWRQQEEFELHRKFSQRYFQRTISGWIDSLRYRQKFAQFEETPKSKKAA